MLTGVLKVGSQRFFALREEEIPPLFSEGFDDQPAAIPAGWVNNGPSNATDWEVGMPSGVASGPTAANSTPYCAGTNIGGYYTENADVSLTSPSFLVPIGSGATLSFKQFIDTDMLDAIDDDVGSVRILDADSFDAPIAGLEITGIEGDGTAGWTNGTTLDMTAGEVAARTSKSSSASSAMPARPWIPTSGPASTSTTWWPPKIDPTIVNQRSRATSDVSAGPECRRHGKMVAGGEVRNERNLRNPIQRKSAPRRRRQKPLEGLETMRSASGAPPGRGHFTFPNPGVPLRSTPGYLLGVPPALEIESFP